MQTGPVQFVDRSLSSAVQERAAAAEASTAAKLTATIAEPEFSTYVGPLKTVCAALHLNELLCIIETEISQILCR